jgi:hypothetical protein
MDAEGVFHPLRPGRRVVLPAEVDPAGPVVERDSPIIEPVEDEAASSRSLRPWAPPPLLARLPLRLVFGVLHEAASGRMIPERYSAAYLEKLRHMIEREETGPLAVLLDRFFSAPYLASGSPSRIAAGLWEELEEIRSPAALVGAWLEGREGALLSRALELVPSGRTAPEIPPETEAFHREISSLPLETFLSLIA